MSVVFKEGACTRNVPVLLVVPTLLLEYERLTCPNNNYGSAACGESSQTKATTGVLLDSIIVGIRIGSDQFS